MDATTAKYRPKQHREERMCTGTATKLLCPHYLVHWRTRCPKRCVLPDQRGWLACTCADCDPQYVRTQIQLKYGAQQERLMAGVRAAMAEGRLLDVKDLERRLRGIQFLRMEELARARIAGLDPALPVRFPGAYEQWLEGNMGRPVDWDALLNK